MIRYWFFAAFVLAIAAASPGGIRRVARSGAPRLQVFRGLLLAVEICVVVLSFVLLGLIGTHAIFAVYPLLVAALAGPVLGEYVGWRRGLAILVGLLGVLVILRPGFQVFSPVALVPLAGALMFALYDLLTRKVALVDRARDQPLLHRRRRRRGDQRSSCRSSGRRSAAGPTGAGWRRSASRRSSGTSC